MEKQKSSLAEVASKLDFKFAKPSDLNILDKLGMIKQLEEIS